MPQRTRRSPARLLAPLAILAFVAALAYVVTSSQPQPDTSRSTAEQEQATDLGTTGTETSRRRSRRNAEDQLPEGCYVVKAGDTLGGIAEKTGVPVDRLQEVNTDIDPQQLVSGQRLNLRDGGCD